ncbi:MAG: substrate-binding domain-containing protein, partial [Acidobacteria bacterium]|nr:substrate-binding domain-containing protein [Acidobacteriota bacterium]
MPARNKFSLLAVATATAALAVPAVASAGTVTMSGSTSIYPLATQLAKGCVKGPCKGMTFRILQGGSDVGVNDVARGRVTFGLSSRDPQSSDPGGLVFNRIARDGVCIVTNPSNRLANISRATVQAIFSGRVRNWSDVPGAKVSGPIELVTRTPASGTADAFQNIFMGQNLRVAGNASQKSSNGLVEQAVRSSKNAISYLDFQFIAGTAPAPFNGVPCNLRNAKSGQYDGVRNLWLVSRG